MPGVAIGEEPDSDPDAHGADRDEGPCRRSRRRRRRLSAQAVRSRRAVRACPGVAATGQPRVGRRRAERPTARARRPADRSRRPPRVARHPRDRVLEDRVRAARAARAQRGDRARPLDDLRADLELRLRARLEEPRGVHRIRATQDRGRGRTSSRAHGTRESATRRGSVHREPPLADRARARCDRGCRRRSSWERSAIARPATGCTTRSTNPWPTRSDWSAFATDRPGEFDHLPDRGPLSVYDIQVLGPDGRDRGEQLRARIRTRRGAGRARRRESADERPEHDDRRRGVPSADRRAATVARSRSPARSTRRTACSTACGRAC